MKSILSLIVILLAFISCTIPSDKGNNYYFDAGNGNDSNNGLSPRTAWRSLEKIKDVPLKAGDSLLFCRGTVFNGILEIEGQGTSDRRIVIDVYGTGEKPCITAPDSSLYAVRIKNSDYITVQNLEIVNKGTERMAHRTGIKVLCDNYGTSHNIVLNALNIHDVNGSLIKHDGGGSAIFIQSKGKETVSVFDSLLIENCIIRRCERNAIIWSAPWSRKNWNLSTNTIVRKNLIEEVPGDGIVPIGCDGALIEYNLMRNCPATLPPLQAAAGIWPWSCDNTVIQFNEVSDHKAPWDGQGFDSDFNCTNTTIQYNYSHDNQGGFILICNAGKTNPEENIGNIGTVVQYNISIGDAIRPHETHAGVFSPTIHIGGPCKNTRINNNILHANKKPNKLTDRTMITADTWDGFPDSTFVYKNVFYTQEPLRFNLTKSTNNDYSGNYYLGKFSGIPEKNPQTSSSVYESIIRKDVNGFDALAPLMEKIEIADGATFVTVVNKKAMDNFFEELTKN
ncbi:MAG: right-handed parallel beta-helix repeat-containing protein [Tannerellaceae bacterium]|jgi:hypothetical protein|nr:right-handed parallel beta-helix repeat-containing protein [Tannerellaceae bacterium]